MCEVCEAVGTRHVAVCRWSLAYGSRATSEPSISDGSAEKVSKSMIVQSAPKQRTHRQLVDITNTYRARRLVPATAAVAKLEAENSAASSVGDMVTFWEQRANMHHRSLPH